MAFTQISDIIEPAIWDKYFLEESTSKSLLIQSGIVVPDQNLQALINNTAGSKTVDMPFWDDLVGNSSVGTDDATAITPAKLTTDQDKAVKLFRNVAFQSASQVQLVAGDDPIARIMDRYVSYWLREEQRILLLTLTGVFADNIANDSSDLVSDIAIEDGDNATASALISSDAIIDAFHLVGDHWDGFTAMIMHSVVFKRLQKLDLIDFVADSVQGIEIPTYLGRRVLVDDGMTTVAGGVSGTKYTTYVFGQGAIARAEVALNEPSIEVYREPTKGTGSGLTQVISRRGLILHPRGIKFAGTPAGSSPADAELNVAGSWDRVYAQKNIRVAQLITNG